ncbi:MAG: class I SAM-dependent methyltransferase [Candidatus Eisenbacteria bacterium]
MSFYSDFAGHYESVFPLEEDTYRFIAKRTPRVGRVLDIGCGTGDYCGLFAQNGRIAVGIDLDREMIAVADERFPEAAFRVMDMGDVGTLEGPFDSIFCIGNVLSHIPASALPGFLSYVADLLPPGGAWVFQTVNWDHILGRDSFRFPDIAVPRTDVVFEREYPQVSHDGVSFVTRLRKGPELLFEGSVELYPLRAGEYAAAHDPTLFELKGHFANFTEAEFVAGSMSSSVFHFARR